MEAWPHWPASSRATPTGRPAGRARSARQPQPHVPCRRPLVWLIAAVPLADGMPMTLVRSPFPRGKRAAAPVIFFLLLLLFHGANPGGAAESDWPTRAATRGPARERDVRVAHPHPRPCPRVRIPLDAVERARLPYRERSATAFPFCAGSLSFYHCGAWWKRAWCARACMAARIVWHSGSPCENSQLLPPGGRVRCVFATRSWVVSTCRIWEVRLREGSGVVRTDTDGAGLAAV